jgi:hypothetical protein
LEAQSDRGRTGGLSVSDGSGPGVVQEGGGVNENEKKNV